MHARFIEMIKKGTTDPIVAKNWHLNMTPVIEKKLREDRLFLITLLRATIKERDKERMYWHDIGRKVVSDVRDIKNALRDFYKEFPPPVITLLNDSIAHEPGAQLFLSRTELTQSLPDKPLTQIFGGKHAGQLIYRDNDNGALFKVPNIWYNQPGKRKVICFDF